MFAPGVLKHEGVHQWDTIREKYNQCPILLGNGFSLNFSETLRYSNLFDSFINTCTSGSKNLFRLLATRNFETVLESIETAKLVTEALDSELSGLDKHKTEIKNGLIKTINQIHPRPDAIDYKLTEELAKQFSCFNNVFTTNYDLYLYYIILDSNIFGDHFFTKASTKFHSFEEPDTKKNNHIYYLHGALFLFEHSINTYKLLKPSNGWLLDNITEEIRADNYPLFISEGKSEGKLKSIQSNPYLTFCFNRLESDGNDKGHIVVFGQSLSSQDYHIASAIDKHFKKAAISLRIDDWSSMGELKAEKNRILSLFKDTDIEFFCSKSLFDFSTHM